MSAARRLLLLPAVLLPCLVLTTAARALPGADAHCVEAGTAPSSHARACDSAVAAAAVLAPPRLVLDSTAVIPFGGTQVARVSGGRPGATVGLFAYTLPNTAYRLIRRSTLDARGDVSWRLQPGGHTSLYAVADGTRTDVTTMRVARTATLGVRRALGVHRFSGVVRRPVGGLQVTLARVLSTGRVVGVGATRTNAAGAYAIDARLGPGKNLYYVLTGATADLLPARSRAYGLDVRPPAALPLAGRTVTLDAGHNGGNAAHPEIVGALVNAGGGLLKPCNTVGTSTNGGYPEHAFTWDVTRRVQALLRAQGARVVLTRTRDDGVGPCIDVRAGIGNRAGSDAVVSIHADGSTSPGARGFHVIAPLSPPAPAVVAAQSDRLARVVRAAFRGTTGIPYANYVAGGDGLDARRDLGGLNLSTRPVVFVECGNMRNAQDAALMTSAAGRQRIAAGIARGVTDHLRR